MVAQLQHCNESTELKDVCKNVNNYDPNMASKPWPTNVKIFMDILEIVDFDWNYNTVTIFVQFWTMWNDTRLSITIESAEAFSSFLLFFRLEIVKN